MRASPVAIHGPSRFGARQPVGRAPDRLLPDGTILMQSQPQVVICFDSRARHTSAGIIPKRTGKMVWTTPGAVWCQAKTLGRQIGLFIPVCAPFPAVSARF